MFIAKNLKHKKGIILCLFLLCTNAVTAQVQVSQEPRHKKVFENNYIRLLDVWIKPGDTSLFHMHSTPSLFLMFTNTAASSQIMGKEWQKGRNEAGKAWYRSFINDTLVHRVANDDTSLFHVTDIELLSPYKPGDSTRPLPYELIFDSEKAFAYKLTRSSLGNKIMNVRGPMIAQLVQGREVVFHDLRQKKQVSILTGKYLYLDPKASFYFSAKEDDNIHLVLFEIK